MNFTRYQVFFNLFSIFLIVSFFFVTFYKYHGFASSLSFNGGVRVSINLPSADFDKNKIDSSMKSIGFEDVIVRKADIYSNIYDFEIGPKIKERILAEVSKDTEKPNTNNQKIITETKTNINKDKDKLNQNRTQSQNQSQSQSQNQNQNQNQSIENKTQNSNTDNYSLSKIIEEKLIKVLNVTKESVISSETIAASYGSNLLRIAIKVVIYTLIGILLYISFRFNVAFAFGACISLIHDLFLSIAFVGVMQIEPSIPVVAAILTLLGYSTNDTIVVFDRIRLNIQEKGHSITNSVVDLSITQTLSRTVITSLLTLLSVLAMLLGGERSLKDFALILIFGIIMGTYSSIFIASPCILYYEQIKNWFKKY